MQSFDLAWMYYLASTASAVIAVITFWVAWGTKITVSMKLAEEARSDARAQTITISALRESFTAYREQCTDRFATQAQVTAIEADLNRNLLVITQRLDSMQRDIYSRLDTVVGLLRDGGQLK